MKDSIIIGFTCFVAAPSYGFVFYALAKVALIKALLFSVIVLILGLALYSIYCNLL